MRLKGLKILMGLAIASSGILLSMALGLWRHPYPNLAAREIPPWQPAENFTSVAVADNQPILSEALARPLFRHSRRPFDAAKATIAEAAPAQIEPQPEAAPPDASQLLVKGIMFDGFNGQALIVTPESPDGIWLAKGADVMGWKIQELSPNGVILLAGKHSAELKLYVDNGPN